MTYLVTAVAVGALLEVVVTWWLLRGLRRVDRMDARLGHLTEALRLLAETTEAGFRASARELSRIAGDAAAEPPAVQAHDVARPKVTAASAKRPPAKRHATTDGHEARAKRRADAAPIQLPAPRRRARRPAAQIAPADAAVATALNEEMSESEARLRLLLAEKNAAEQATTREVGRVALRA